MLFMSDEAADSDRSSAARKRDMTEGLLPKRMLMLLLSRSKDDFSGRRGRNVGRQAAMIAHAASAAVHFTSLTQVSKALLCLAGG